MDTTRSEDGDERGFRDVLESLRDEVQAADVTATIHSDDSNMTPMLVVEFDRGADRADVVRRLFRAEGPVEVTGIYDHKVVVRGADRDE
ncbi:hypothetical protein ACKVMT_03790 [Halobacteriales archaeon Cl-PHB]